MTSVSENAKKRETLYTAGGKWKWNNLAVPQMIKCWATVRPRYSSPTYRPRRNGTMYSQKSLYTDVYTRVVYNSQKKETAQMPLS